MNYKKAHKAAKRSNFSDKSIENLFTAEQVEYDEYETKRKYAGMTSEQKQQAMKHDFAEIDACNDVFDYYN